MLTSKFRLTVMLMLALVAVAASGMVVSAQGQPKVFLPLVMGPPPPPPVIAIRNDSLYSVSEGEGGSTEYHLIGEAVNVSDRPFQTIRILADAVVPGQNTPLESETQLAYLAPGDVMVFDITFTSFTPGLSSYTLAVEHDEATVPPPLTLAVLSISFNAGSSSISGEVRNDTSDTIQNANGRVGMYDSTGKLQVVYRVEVISSDSILQPGQTAPFEGSTFGRYDPSWTARVWVQGRRQQ